MTLFVKLHAKNIKTLFCSLALFVLLLAAWPADAATPGKYKDPTEAFNVFVAAVQKGEVVSLMTRIFGPDTQSLFSSGNKELDAQNRKAFLDAYRVYHAVEVHNGAEAYLIVGSNSWIFPVPVVLKNKTWEFDVARGRREITARRVGRNERFAVQATLAYVDAQRDYFDMNPLGLKAPAYAQKFNSTPGEKDGLYWPAAAGEQPSPLGAAFASASAATRSEGQAATKGAPFEGYYYRIITAQGDNAGGGAYDYIVNGKMIGGFALIATPAEYGKTGVMTFAVNQDGVVYEKNLGGNTTELAAEIVKFDPDPSWHVVNPAYTAPIE